eukprot:TRINITY_DN7227_c0_g1_i1.p1 TRINITY_DN7227_c0_g1~~TRINITY_DN7227_c0_g1_i1.p1  ORF type:complete len:261 (-),score=65.77 TRINITY_DN7227_c0_g1_i1:12-794(-)
MEEVIPAIGKYYGVRCPDDHEDDDFWLCTIDSFVNEEEVEVTWLEEEIGYWREGGTDVIHVETLICEVNLIVRPEKKQNKYFLTGTERDKIFKQERLLDKMIEDQTNEYYGKNHSKKKKSSKTKMAIQPVEMHNIFLRIGSKDSNSLVSIKCNVDKVSLTRAYLKGELDIDVPFEKEILSSQKLTGQQYEQFKAANIPIESLTSEGEITYSEDESVFHLSHLAMSVLWLHIASVGNREIKWEPSKVDIVYLPLDNQLDKK